MKHNNLAHNLYEAVKLRLPITQVKYGNELGLEDAYAIQQQIIDLKLEEGEQLSGIKMGFTSKPKMEQVGVNAPIWGRLTNTMMIPNDGVLHLNNYIRPRAEPEIAFLLKEDLTMEHCGLPLEDLASGVAVAMEICDSRYRDFKFSLWDVIADNCFAAGYVLGQWKTPETGISDIAMTLNCNGKTMESGNSNSILGNPLTSLWEAIKLTTQYGFGLKRGMVVLAGAATPSIYLNSGDKVEVTAEQLGSVNIKVEA
ncbi:2-keto-4-pentenoate hydratase [Flagellimonas flava]|uniref:2-oxo-3-hexenedioate decarboxylase n=1 Tax=Flagellimonas flava TaxID=570519 RepID=A0A1M5K049_9FLAO|nr:fumarylacetoacetate hydrolase family protein [Allomuricauda flava]SHG46138.1 2-oxo-3-hexenedioate decarboxylase [Allomuricauda flava]